MEEKIAFQNTSKQDPMDMNQYIEAKEEPKETSPHAIAQLPLYLQSIISNLTDESPQDDHTESSFETKIRNLTNGVEAIESELANLKEKILSFDRVVRKRPAQVKKSTHLAERISQSRAITCYASHPDFSIVKKEESTGKKINHAPKAKWKNSEDSLVSRIHTRSRKINKKNH